MVSPSLRSVLRCLGAGCEGCLSIDGFFLRYRKLGLLFLRIRDARLPLLGLVKKKKPMQHTVL